MRSTRVTLSAVKVILENPFRKEKVTRSVFIPRGTSLSWEAAAAAVVPDCLNSKPVFRQIPIKGKPVIRVATPEGDTYYTVVIKESE